MSATVSAEDAIYPIGAVSTLTGLPPSTIRSWERRYGLAASARSPGGGRRYTEADVAHLVLLRRATQTGLAIGDAARLEVGELRQALRVRSDELGKLPAPVRVTVLCQNLEARLKRAHVDWVIELLVPPFDGSGAPQSDVVIASLEELGEEPASRLEAVMDACSATHAVVLYHFARRDLIEALAGSAVRVIQEPVSTSELQDIVEDLIGEAPEAEEVSRVQNQRPLFSPSQLSRLRDARSGIFCECPNHLANLVSSLVHFEEYSRRCASRDEKDAALHRSLYEGTGAARRIVETLLVDVVRHEGLEDDSVG